MRERKRERGRARISKPDVSFARCVYVYTYISTRQPHSRFFFFLLLPLLLPLSRESLGIISVPRFFLSFWRLRAYTYTEKERWGRKNSATPSLSCSIGFAKSSPRIIHSSAFRLYVCVCVCVCRHWRLLSPASSLLLLFFFPF